MHLYYRFLDAVAPPLSIRRQFLALTRQAPSVLLTQGPGPVWTRTRAALLRYRETGALIIPDPTTIPPQPQPEPEPYTYAQWIADNEPSQPDLAAQRTHANHLAYRPLVSIIVPVYNPPVGALEAAILSVLAQTYLHWQLCLVDGASDDPSIGALLDRYANQDKRIRVTRLPDNLGISGNSNTALSLADGEFVALLDHDDTLASNMLYEVATLLNREPSTDVIYFDEDKLSADGGTRNHPWFKPDFSPDLMLSTNLLMHGVYRRTLVDKAGGFDPSTDGAQDWDLALRCTRRTRAIRHIPKVLYHWRQIAGSASTDAAAKPWAFDAQAAAIERHILETDSVQVHVEFPSLGRTHIIWPPRGKRVSIIVPTKDKLDLLQPCLESIFAHTSGPEYEVILVDTGSAQAETNAYYERLQTEHAHITVTRVPGRFNFSRACNVGAQSASGEMLLFLNNDTEALEPGWLQELAGWADRPHVGVVGAKLLRPTSLIQHAGIVIGLAGHGSHIFEDTPEDAYGVFGSTEWYRTYQAVTGACMMIPRAVFDALGGFDEVYQIGYSDIDFCLRAADAGYRTVYTPFARLLHKEGSSRGFYVPASDVLRGSGQMLPLIRAGDHNFSPNLSTHYRRPTFARPDEASSVDTVVEILRAYRLLPPHLPDITPPIHDVEVAQPTAWPQAGSPRVPIALFGLSILIATHDLSASGAPLFAALLAQELAHAGARVSVISPEDGPVRERLESAGVAVQIAPSMPDFHGTSLLTRLDIGALTHAVSRHDLVIANSIVTALAVNTATAYGKPSVFWLHESHFGHKIATHDANVRAALLDATRVVLLTPYLADLYRDFLSPDNCVVVPPALDESALVAPEVAVADFPADKTLLISVGSIEPRKGQDFLLSSFKKLPSSLQDQCELYFLGRTVDPEYAEGLHAQAAGAPNIHFPGSLPHDEIMSYLHAADIFVLSSQDEVLPLSLLEAMHHRVAIVATLVGGVPQAIDDGESGVLVNFGDRRALTVALTMLVQDAGLRARLGENAARAFHDHYTIGAFRTRLINLIAEAAPIDSEAEPARPSP